MNIPNEIKIGGHRVRIEKVNSERERDTGAYDIWYKVIRVNTDSSPESAQAEAFLHEIIEAVKALNNLELDHKELSIISEALFAIIRNNNLDFREEIKKHKRHNG